MSGTRFDTRFLLAYLLIALGTPNVWAQSLRTAEYGEGTRAGLDHLYRVEHAEAVRTFDELSKQFPEHPGPPLSMAVSIWLKELVDRQELDLDRFISPGYFNRPRDEPMEENDRAIFESGVARSQALATAWLEDHPEDIDARYYLGACEAALGVFAFTIDRNYRRALRHGKKSYRIQKAIIEDNPDFSDSYLTIGTYEYIVGNLPWYIKWIAAIAGYRGSESRGFEYLVRAAEDGFLVKNDARVMLMVLYVREKRYDYGLEMAQQLHRRYPENYLLHLNRVQILEKLDRHEEAARMLLQIVAHSEGGVRNYQKLDTTQLRYALGTRLLALDKNEQALEQFRAAIDNDQTPLRDRVYSTLRAGEALEGLGRYDEARRRYLQAERLHDIDGSSRRARRLREKLDKLQRQN